MIDHVGIYGSRVAEGLSAFNVGLVRMLSDHNENIDVLRRFEEIVTWDPFY